MNINHFCVLCSRDIVKSTERYRVNSNKEKFDVTEELKSLPFVVRNSGEFICKACLANLKKRKRLIEQLKSVESDLKRSYSESEGSSLSATLIGRGENEERVLNSTPKKRCLSHSTARELTVSPISTNNAEKTQSDVTINVKWKSKKASRMLPPDLESIGKMLVRGTYKQIAHATWKNVNLKKHLVELILKEVEKEAIGLCSKKHPSILRMTDKESMLNLSMDSISLELKDRAPLIHSTLSTIAINRNSRASSDKKHVGPIAMAVAILLKNRSRYMTALQLLVTIFLYHSNWMVSILPCHATIIIFLLS